MQLLKKDFMQESRLTWFKRMKKNCQWFKVQNDEECEETSACIQELWRAKMFLTNMTIDHVPQIPQRQVHEHFLTTPLQTILNIDCLCSYTKHQFENNVFATENLTIVSFSIC